MQGSRRCSARVGSRFDCQAAPEQAIELASEGFDVADRAVLDHRTS
jgi:hypothetical protein